MTIPKVPIEGHDIHSERLIAQAEEELAKGDRLQASEKAWGAVAHQLKVIADQRGWEYNTHQQVYRVVSLLSDEVGGQELKDIFGIANSLHQNFYADVKPLEQLENEIGRVKDLLDMLKCLDLG